MDKIIQIIVLIQKRINDIEEDLQEYWTEHGIYHDDWPDSYNYDDYCSQQSEKIDLLNEIIEDIKKVGK